MLAKHANLDFKKKVQMEVGKEDCDVLRFFFGHYRTKFGN